jgi:PAS domain S-box-containing protein
MRPPDDSAALLAAIVASSDDAIISKDLNGTVTSWNQGAERLFGYMAAEMIGQHITRIIPADRLSEEDFVLSRVRRGLSVNHFETVRQRKDGSLVEISLTVSPVRNGTGQVIGISKIARDITEQKRLRNAVEEASRAKDEFLATLSHELRTPLNTVLGYTQMLQHGSVGTDLPKVLGVIARNAELLANLVNEVLDTSRMVTGKIRLNLQPCDVSAVLDDSIAAVLPAARAKSIQVHSRIETRPLMTIADASRIRQVLWTLLSNAVKFTSEGGTLTVTAAFEGQHVRITVEDTGIGIPPDALPHVFARFWQADATRTRVHGGLGLGLALARDLVELHGGHVEVHSPGVGRGTRFDVVVPVASVPAVT